MSNFLTSSVSGFLQNFTSVGNFSSFISRNWTMIVVDLDEFAPASGASPADITTKEAMSFFLSELQTNLSKVMGDLFGKTTFLSKAALVGQVAKEIMTTSSKFYKFRINPTRMTPTYGKMHTLTQYGWGRYDVESFGNKILMLNYEGTTGSLVTSPTLQRMGINDIRLSKAWLKFAAFRNFFVNNNKLVLVIFEHEAMIAHFDSFSYTQDGNDPWQIKYNFNLIVFPETIMDLFSGMVVPNVLRYGKRILGSLGGMTIKLFKKGPSFNDLPSSGGSFG